MTPRSLDRRTHGRAWSTRVTQVAGSVTLAIIGVVFARQSTATARTAEPTFAHDVAPLIYKNCTTCHRPGGLGPFSLLDYDSAAKKLDEIQDAVSSGYMPPWHADGPHGTV